MVLAFLAALGIAACVIEDGDPILAGGDTTEPEDVVERPDDFAADGDADADDRGVEEVREDFGADGDGDGDGDADAGCTPMLSAPYNVVLTAGDGEERPVALRSGDGFVFFGRPPGPVSGDGLRFQRFRLDGVASTAAMWTLSSVEIGPQHPLIELPDRKFANAFAVPSGAGPGIWVKIVPSSGTGGEIPRLVPGTDENSSSPALTFDGTDVVAAWMQYVAGTVEIRAQHVDARTGDAIGTYVTVASGPTGTMEPRIVWGGIRHALTYFSATDGSLHVLSLDGALSTTREDILAPAVGESFIGYPALAWSGMEFGLAWETRGFATSTIHLATFMPDAAPVERASFDSTESLFPDTAGQVALAHGVDGGEWGIAWSDAQADRTTISLLRIAATDFHIKDGPVDIRPEAIAASNPSIAYNNGYYMVTWVEQLGGFNFPIYEATYGCTR